MVTVNLSNATFKSSGSTTSRSVGTRAADVINVKDYGAVGDGVTDDRAAIQAAFDAAFGSSGSPNGYTNRYLNKAVYFPKPAVAGSTSAGYTLSDSVTLTHVYGGLIYGDMTHLSINPGTGAAGSPCVVVNGMVETTWMGISLFSRSTSPCNLDLDWDGTWTDLPAGSTTQGLRHNVFMNMELGTAQRSIRVAHSSNDGAHNSFWRIICQSNSIAGIEIQGSNAYGNMVMGGGADTLAGSTGIGYWANGGGFSVIQGVSNGTNVGVDFQIDSVYPCAILGGRSEGNGTILKVSSASSAPVCMKGFLINNGGIGVANVNSGKVIFDACEALSGGNYITSSSSAHTAGTIYIRGCDFPSSLGFSISSFYGTVAQNI